jgi:hypothetical protein
MQLASGPQARQQAKGCDGQLTKAWMKHLGTGRGPNFTGGQHTRGVEEGDGFGRVPGVVAGRVRNGFHSQRREADVWGLQDTEARLAVTRGGKRRGPAS